jgi:hypothetical protein
MACMKNCAEAQFHLAVNVVQTKDEIDLLNKVIEANADEIMYLSSEGIEGFLKHLKDLKATRLTIDLKILMCQQFEAQISKQVKETITQLAQMPKSSRLKIRRAHVASKPMTVKALPGNTLAA